MIRDFSGEKSTPKQLAQLMIMDGLSVTLGYWQERYQAQTEAMTDLERERFEAQLRKQAKRVANLLGYEDAWES